MKTLRVRLLACLVVLGALGCGAFDDPTPTNVTLSIRGTAGTPVLLLLSTQFVAAIDENGTTGVTVFRSDSVFTSLPVDTVVNIEIDRQFFVQVVPVGQASIDVDVIVDIDDRNVVNERGAIFSDDPWRFVYIFNRRLSRSIQVII